MGKKNEEFIVRYTNKDIMDKLESIDIKIDHTKGISKRALITATAAMTLTLIVLGFLFTHVTTQVKP